MAEKDITIGLFGRRKTGKTNLISSLKGQGKVPAESGAVANIPLKLKGLGDAHLLVPAGLDDERALGIGAKDAKVLLERIDMALVVIDASLGWSDYERFLLSKIRFSGDPVVAIINAEPDEDTADLKEKLKRFSVPSVVMDLSGKADGSPVVELLVKELDRVNHQKNLLEDVANDGDVVWLVVPDRRASYLDPVGPTEMRLTADAVEIGATISVIRKTDFRKRWEGITTNPDLIIVDMTVFSMVQDVVPDDLPLTSLTVLVARQRGELDAFVRGAEAISDLQAGDRVLISEGCGLHVQPDDIGRVEIPNLLRQWVGGDLEFSTSDGTPLFDGITGFKLVVRCGACMLDPETASGRLKVATEQKVPVTNYGIAQAYLHGILLRMLEPFVAAKELKQVKSPGKTLPVELHDEYSLPPSM